MKYLITKRSFTLCACLCLVWLIGWSTTNFGLNLNFEISYCCACIFRSILASPATKLQTKTTKDNDTLPGASITSSVKVNATSTTTLAPLPLPSPPQFQPSPISSGIATTFTNTANAIQENTSNLMKTAQNFLQGLIGGLQNFNTNLAGIIRRGAPSNPPISTSAFVTNSKPNSANITGAGKDDQLNEVNNDNDASKNYIIL